VNSTTENNSTDQYLVAKVLGGDTNAFAAVIKNTEALVAQIVFKMIPNRDDRKDIAQDIYLKTFQKLSSFRFQSKLSTWIAQIAYNTCLSYLDKKKLVFPGTINDDDESGENALESLAVKTGQSTNDAGAFISKKELAAILSAEIDKLSPVYKLLITLYHNEELTYFEIADITQLPVGTVKSYLSRARKTLRDNLLLTYKKEAL
jgi:RNA polymerase sigma factor (sigma-70 family)